MRTLRSGKGSHLFRAVCFWTQNLSFQIQWHFHYIRHTLPSEPSHRGWTTGAGLEVVVMAKALIAPEILCTFASRARSVNGNDIHLGVCFVFQSWGSEIHVSHPDEVGQFFQTSLLLWPTSLTCLVPKMPLSKILWLLSVCLSVCTPKSHLFWMLYSLFFKFFFKILTYWPLSHC